MVFRPPTDQQVLDMQNVESFTLWIVSFVAKCCVEKEKNKPNTDDTISDLQITNIFLSMCKEGKLLKLRSLMSRKGH